jgi:predicted NBD/HSP70 family sugar kinase
MSTQGSSPFLPDDVPADPQDARRINRNRVLRSIITRGPATRAELSRRVGLSRPTISVIANELLTNGLLGEGERVSSGGAPGTLLEIAKDTGVTIVADMRDRERIRLATVSANGEVVTENSVAVTSGQRTRDAIVAFTRRLEPEAALGVALAVPGWVTPEGHWESQPARPADPDLEQQLRRELRLQVFSVNAVDAIAIADLRDSPPDLAAQGSVVLDARVGLGLIISGRLRTGIKRPAGDISHVVPGTPGPRCTECGRACLQAQVFAVRDEPSVADCELAAAALAAVLAPIAGAVELEELVLSGFPAGVEEAIAQLTSDGLTRRLPWYQVPAVRVSQRGQDAVLIGAAAMMLYRWLG